MHTTLHTHISSNIPGYNIVLTMREKNFNIEKQKKKIHFLPDVFTILTYYHKKRFSFRFVFFIIIIRFYTHTCAIVWYHINGLQMHFYGIFHDLLLLEGIYTTLYTTHNNMIIAERQ